MYSDNFAETAVFAVSSNLRSQVASFIPQWWFYYYDRMAPFNFIGDGGGDMYDGGNRVITLYLSQFLYQSVFTTRRRAQIVVAAYCYNSVHVLFFLRLKFSREVK